MCIRDRVGTIQVGLYSNYTIVLNTLTNVVNQLSAAMSGSIGNLLATGSKAHVDVVLRRLLFLMYGIASFCCTCLLCLLDPFITLVFGNEMVLDFPVVCVCVLNFFLATMRIPVWNMLSASGLFKRDKYISIAGSTVNLVVSFVLGKEIGMLGILIGTTCTYAIQFVLKILLFYRRFLHRPCRKLFLQLGLYLALTLASVSYTHLDVYKRQHLRRTVGQNLPRCPAMQRLCPRALFCFPLHFHAENGRMDLMHPGSRPPPTYFRKEPLPPRGFFKSISIAT